jgi:hypothetical protein
MRAVASRPWSAHEDMFLRQLAAAGKYAAANRPVEMKRSDAAIRNHAALLNVKLAKVQRGPKAKGK